MTYIVENSTEPPYFLLGSFEDEWSIRVPDIKRRSEITGVFKVGRSVLWLEDTPSSLKLERPNKRLLDIFKSMGGITLVSDPLRSLIEELDPGLHQFIPIFLFDSGGRPIDHRYYIMNVNFEQDSIVDELSTVRRNAGMPDNPNTMYITFWSGVEFKVIIDPTKIGPANLWREKRYGGSMLLSDRLVREIKERKLKFQKLRKVMHLKPA